MRLPVLKDLPEVTKIDHIEPYLRQNCVPHSTVMQLVVDHRGVSEGIMYLSDKSVEMILVTSS